MAQDTAITNKPPLAPEPPFDSAAVPHHAGDMPAESLLQRRRPRDELEASALDEDIKN